MGLTPILNYNGRLSEGPTYNPSNNSLLWVDIIAGKFHRVFLPLDAGSEYSIDEAIQLKGSHEEFVVPNESIGVIYLTSDDNIVYLGAKAGIAEYNLLSREFTYKWLYPNASKLRSNDGNISPDGDIWQGLMGSFEHGPIPEGLLLKLDRENGEFTTVIDNVLISNGINWSKDGSHLFWTSSLDFTIYKFDYDKGEISNKTAFIKIKDFYPDVESPEPDGFALTEDGDLFTAVFSTGTVAHFDHEGKLVEKFTFPAKRITACSFGGVDREELFITSANLNLNEPERLDENPEDLGGAIFRIKLPGHRGLLRPKLEL